MQMCEFLIYEGLEHVLEQIVAGYEDYIQAEERTDIRDYLIRKENFTVMINDGRKNAYTIGELQLKGICISKGQCKLIVEEDGVEKDTEISGQITIERDIKKLLEALNDFEENRP